MGATVNRFFTPEERVEFARSLEARNAAMARADAYDFLLPAAEKAGYPLCNPGSSMNSWRSGPTAFPLQLWNSFRFAA